MIERPDIIRLNPFAPLANGLVFAGLAPGGLVGSTLYPDSSLYGRNGTLNNFAFTGTASNWLFDSTLGRWCIACDGTDDWADLSGIPLTTPPWTITYWFFGIAMDGYRRLFSASGPDSPWPGYEVRTAGSIWQLWDGTDWRNLGATASGVWEFHALVHTGSSISHRINNTVTTTASSSSTFYTTKAFFAQNGGGNAIGAKFSDVCGWSHLLTSSELDAFADPSNVYLSGLILPPRRKWWPAVSINQNAAAASVLPITASEPGLPATINKTLVLTM